MINLHEKFNHYLHTDKTHDWNGIKEALIGYGWRDDGSNIIGYYLLTKEHKQDYTLDNKYLGKESA